MSTRVKKLQCNINIFQFHTLHIDLHTLKIYLDEIILQKLCIEILINNYKMPNIYFL